MALRLITPTPDEDRDDTAADEDAAAKKAELTEHLAELRTRLIRAIIYAVVGMGIVWAFFHPIYAVVSAPITSTLHRLPGSSFRFNTFTEAFFLQLNVSMVGGLILAAPFIVLELWGFVAPALTPTEKRAVRFVAPLSIGLFALGVACAYLVTPMAVRWFVGYMSNFPDAALLQDPLQYAAFAVKMPLIFGLVFQLPVILMFLGRAGLLTSATMVKYWRHVIVVIFPLAMVVAPSNDIFTMMALAVPLTLLFLGSIWLVKCVEPKPSSS